MSPEQFARWKDFACRMARQYPGRSRKFRTWLEEQVEGFLCEYVRAPERVVTWEGGTGLATICDEADEWAQSFPGYWVGRRPTKRFEERVEGPFRCCVRAGLDIASTPSAGVVGFTVGDLRRMYPEGLPAWVLEFFEEPELVVKARDEEAIWL